MNKVIRALVLGLVLSLASVTAVSAADPPPPEPAPTPVIDGTTSEPTSGNDPGVALSTSPQGSEANTSTYTYYGCQTGSNNFSANNTNVTKKACIERRSSDGAKRLKVRITCRTINTGALTTCHHWWSQDPRGHTATYRYYCWTGFAWYVAAYSNVRSPALNTSMSVAYSGWQGDFNGYWVQGRLRNLGVTVHGGSYAYPFNQDTANVFDGVTAGGGNC